MTSHQIEDLRSQARVARERYQLYKARTFGQRPTSEERLRELQRAYEQAEERRRFAEDEEQRAHGAHKHPQGLS
jgi:predicted  nucleic acid-binding Zn-ribbon protein